MLSLIICNRDHASKLRHICERTCQKCDRTKCVEILFLIYIRGGSLEQMIREGGGGCYELFSKKKFVRQISGKTNLFGYATKASLLWW